MAHLAQQGGRRDGLLTLPHQQPRFGCKIPHGQRETELGVSGFGDRCQVGSRRFTMSGAGGEHERKEEAHGEVTGWRGDG
jgi:hypothetical protein